MAWTETCSTCDGKGGYWSWNWLLQKVWKTCSRCNGRGEIIHRVLEGSDGDPD